MADAYDIFIVADEPIRYITLFDFDLNRLGRNSDLIINDPDIPDIPAKLALQTSDLFDPDNLRPFLGFLGFGIFEAILMPTPPDFTVFLDEGWQVFQLGTGGVLFDPATSLVIGGPPPTAGDALIDFLALAPDGPVDAGKGADYLPGAPQAHTVFGGAGDDTVEGQGGADSIQGQGGQDVLDGGNGNDTLLGGSMSDSVTGGGGEDSLSGNAGHDTLSGNGGDDLLQGGTGRDTLSGEGGKDVLKGGSGDDTLNGGSSKDVLNGGSGTDLAAYIGDQAVSVDLAIQGFQNTGGAGRDKLVSIEELEGSSGNDTLLGDAAENQLSGGSGDDSLNGRDGDDNLLGGRGNDTLRGGGGKDTLEGGDGHDVLNGQSGNDSLSGGTGNDTLKGGSGRDVLNGGGGTDIADYSGTQGIEASLGIDGFQTISGHGQDRLVDMDGLIGSDAKDVLTGQSQERTDSWLFGGKGNDRLIAMAGDNWLFGESGADTLMASVSDDRVLAIMEGGGGNDLLKLELTGWVSVGDLDGGIGDDVLDILLEPDGHNLPARAVAAGGAGADTFVLRGSVSNVQIDDFEFGTDKIEITEAASDFSDLTIGYNGFQWGVTAGGTEFDPDFILNIIDFDNNALTADDFIFT
ncbi:MAG: calcium-binding protein [Leisingera sp.]